MLAPLPPTLRGMAAGTLLAISTTVLTLAMFPPALLKLLLPFDGARRVCDRALTALASAWVAINLSLIHISEPTRPY